MSKEIDYSNGAQPSQPVRANQGERQGNWIGFTKREAMAVEFTKAYISASTPACRGNYTGYSQKGLAQADSLLGIMEGER